MTTRPPAAASLVFICMFGATVAVAQPISEPTSAPTAPQRERVTFTAPSPLAGLDEYCRRTRQNPATYKREGNDHEYTLADESFEAVVPPACGPGNPHGLLVWVSPGGANLPREWLEVCERHKLIWISPNNAGNGRHFVVRIGLALDVVQNAKAKYAIDAQRIYVSGFSGGGRIASLAGLTYPDVFTGALPMMGCNFYRPLPAGDGKFFQAGASKPIDQIFGQAKRLPFVLFTGSEDGNRPQTKANFDAMQKDGFKRVSYIEVPDVGHKMPGAEWFDRALTELDAAAIAAASDGIRKGPATRPATRRAVTR